jgi:hypothetical protein
LIATTPYYEGVNWLITTRTSTDLVTLGQRLAALGCRVANASNPIPLDQGQQTLEVEGPEDLPARLRGDPDVIGVYPNSEQQLYGGTDPARARR